MGLYDQGKILLQNAIKGVSQEIDPAIALISAYGSRGASTFESTKQTITWGTTNATTGLPMTQANIQFAINLSGGSSVTINKLKLYYNDNGSAIEVGEVDVDATTFTVDGFFVLSTLNLNFNSNI
jgi:hypothetical protein